MARLLVGTSGFVYPHWRRIFYPEGLPSKRWLFWYAQIFATVELNNTFYRLPTKEAVDKWREGTPRGFVFAVKGSRFLTHMKRLTETGQGVTRFFDPVKRLGDKLGPVLWQLPPQMTKPDPERLDRFLSHLPRRVRHAFEFRSEGWYVDEVCDVLDRHYAAFVEHDHVQRAPPRHTGGFRYLRFHGASAPYSGRYGRIGLAAHARDLVAWRRRGRDAYVYFNNDIGGHAVLDALDLLDLIGEPAALPAEAAVER